MLKSSIMFNITLNTSYTWKYILFLKQQELEEQIVYSAFEHFIELFCLV